MSSSSMHGKVIAITGGASGIGLAAAIILYNRGASISIADNDQAALDKASTLFKNPTPTTPNPRLKLTNLDVRNRTAVDAWISSTVTWGGKNQLDCAVNSAGVIGKHHGIRPVEDLDDSQWDLIIGVNLTGMMYCLRAELKNMPGPGSVVCVSSIQGTNGFALHGAYSASKHGILGLVRSAAKEVGGRGVRVNAITPGAIATPLMDKRDELFGGKGQGDQPTTPIPRLGTAEECGTLIAWLLSDEASFVTGGTYGVDGGWGC
ncbi:MAG: hypothetical protein M1834_008310 [Cirrosporium novae-zelandiae]|nr:MAG: hypothetical protein M1834_008310 [Cirrosporium novae-zelandiae]